MLYFDHCMCKVWEGALHIVHNVNHLQVLKQAKKSFCNSQLTHQSLSRPELKSFPDNSKKEIPGISQLETN